MPTIRVLKKIESETITLPELKPLIGKEVEIIVRVESQPPFTTEKDWEDFFAIAGTDLVDPEVYKQYREFDRKNWKLPKL